MTETPLPFDGAALLTRTAALGPYFALPTVAAGAGQDVAALLADEAVVRDFVDRTRGAIAASMACETGLVPRRMAASSFQMGVVARLLSPVLGAATLGARVPLLTETSVRWLGSDGHAPRFGLAGPHWAPAAERAADAIATSVLACLVGPLTDTLAAAVGLSPRISWGNASSAANGAVTVLAMTRPDLEHAGRALVADLLRTDPLRGTAHVTDGRFVRRSCCLFYRAPGGGLCQDCVLATR
ncbi:(2Fe-2S)-binding protein [Mycolicibacterium madagascariense]|nr:(2Fe-2S)-binding protein [Mycolicibacterium madagascariense]MCV7013487.1 (2Fe-2S)-binding protein [Mycolicibacterium madagascariense]